MSRGVTASPQSYAPFSTSRIPLIIPQRRCYVALRANPLFSPNLIRISSGSLKFPRFNLRCESSADSGENERKRVVDAFFLGKAVGEVLTERLESTVGEFLSLIGRLQAEQQKQLSEFQEEVLEKAKRAKEEASREAHGSSTANRVSETASSSAVVSTASNEDPLLGINNKD